MADKHDWQSWDAYQQAHEGNLQRFPTFILGDHLRILVTPKLIRWDGYLTLDHAVELAVRKLQTVRYRRDGRPEVRTTKYSYHAMVTIAGSKYALLRYDNAHPHPQHPDDHHKHVRTESGRTKVVHVGEAGWPTLGEVIDELEQYVFDGRLACLVQVLKSGALPDDESEAIA